MTHTRIRHLLYDYLSGALPDHERGLVRDHLENCSGCGNELQQLEQTLATIACNTSSPAGAHPADLWSRLADRIEQAIATQEQKHRVAFRLPVQRMAFAFRLRRGPALGATACAVAAVLALIVITREFRSPDHPPTGAPATIAPASAYEKEEAHHRMSEYLRKSRTLLVEIANMRRDRTFADDLNAEQQFSRALVQEARALKQRSLDSRTARLVSNLEKIFIELANLEPTRERPNIEVIRSGIVQENLLFKLRMAEASFDTAQVASDGY